MLKFYPDRFSAGLTPFTLKVYMAAITAFHTPHLDIGTLGRHQLVVRFLCGACRMRPATRSRGQLGIWPWSLKGCHLPLRTYRVGSKNLTFKMVFLLAISSLKRVGNLQALAISLTYLGFAPVGVKAILHHRPGYVPNSYLPSMPSHVTS